MTPDNSLALLCSCIVQWEGDALRSRTAAKMVAASSCCVDVVAFVVVCDSSFRMTPSGLPPGCGFASAAAASSLAETWSPYDVSRPIQGLPSHRGGCASVGAAASAADAQ